MTATDIALWVGIGAGIVGILWGGSVFVRWGMGKLKRPAARKPQRAIAPDYVTPKYLTDLSAGKTGLRTDLGLWRIGDPVGEASDRVEQHIGEWMPMRGRAIAVEETPNGAKLTLSIPTGPLHSVYAWTHFDEPWRSRALAVQNGTTVDLTGSMTNANATGVLLEHCELVEGKG